MLLRALRGPGAESEHRGAYCVLRGGDVIAATGDCAAPCWVRSGAKWFQAMVNLLSGAPERYALAPRHLALMCASHEGQEAHTTAASEMLAAGRLSVDDLDCPRIDRHIGVITISLQITETISIVVDFL